VHPHERFIVVNGLRLHYREWGASPARTILLLHGGSAHAHWWDLFADSCSTAYRLVALDLRGHGDSAHRDPPAYQIEDYVDDVAALIDELALARVDVVAHSLGALVAAAYAGRAPQRVHSLVVVDSPLRISASSARYMDRLRNFPQPIYRDRAQAVRRFRLLPVRTEASPEVLAHVATHGICQLDDGRWSLKFDREALANHTPQDFSPILAALTCPILLVRGAHSTLLTPAALSALHAVAPHAETAEIPNAHHHVMLDNPPAFEAAVRGFLDRAWSAESVAVSPPVQSPLNP
jgi:pimeloyl-ACP methyl ester carboxylesterase